MLEIEKTYLAKKLPNNLRDFKSVEIIDIYIPKNIKHPKIRLRKKGDKFELTKKEPVDCHDVSEQEEQTIVLTEAEFSIFNEQLDGKEVSKRRYFYNHNNQIAEFDIFQNDLEGLVVIDFEFKTKSEKDNFIVPDFCLAEVTQEDFIAGGMLCGKTYKDIEQELDRFGYKKLSLK